LKVVRTRAELQAWHAEHGGSLGFVPTMGNLHAGHLGLVTTAQGENDRVAVSIFVNPTQFGPGEDFASYPRTLEADTEALRQIGCDLLFVPETATIYPAGAGTAVVPGAVAAPLCGRFRPGHFQGVATVVAALFNLVRPTASYFGQKDWQQCMVLRRLVLDLAFPVEIVLAPTVREADGLAMSSRNRYLQPDQRQQALQLSRSLAATVAAFEAGQTDTAGLQTLLRAHLAAEPAFRLQYAEIVDAETLAPVAAITGRPAVAAVAGHLGTTRLIDNRPLGDIAALQRTSPWP
jgi:pantoate--beta-alanine ligase